MRTCIKCLMEKEDEEFSFKVKSRGIRHSRCKLCFKEYSKVHYKNNSQDYKRRSRYNRENEKSKTKSLLDLLKGMGCIICGENRLPTLEFHHLDPNEKEYTISKLDSRKKILEESKKCVVICSNCHKMEHYHIRNGLESTLNGQVG